MKPVWVLGFVAVILALGVVPAFSQPVISAKSGTIAYVQGSVFLDDQLVEQSITRFPEIKENSVLRTAAGRAEVLLTPGVTLRMGENGSFKMISNRLIDTRLELLTGSAVVEADDIAKDTSVTVVCKAGAVTLAKIGGYRFDTEPARVKVFKGAADVRIDDQNVLVASGRMLSLDGGVASTEKFDAEDTDSLDRWSNVRAGYMAMANVSAAKYMRDSYPSLDYNVWGWNPYYGMYTFIPTGNRSLCNPFYGYCYWTPYSVYSAFYDMPVAVHYGNGGFNSGGSGFSYPTAAQTSGGYSGAIAASPSMSSVSSSPASSSGSTAASSAASSSVGRGSGSSGGHGH